MANYWIFNYKVLIMSSIGHSYLEASWDVPHWIKISITQSRKFFKNIFVSFFKLVLTRLKEYFDSEDYYYHKSNDLPTSMRPTCHLFTYFLIVSVPSKNYAIMVPFNNLWLPELHLNRSIKYVFNKCLNNKPLRLW